MMNILAIQSRQCAPPIGRPLVSSAPGVGVAQSVNAKVDVTVTPDYHPSMGDLIIVAVQPRGLCPAQGGLQHLPPNPQALGGRDQVPYTAGFRDQAFVPISAGSLP
jgi:hypothetical protein